MYIFSGFSGASKKWHETSQQRIFLWSFFTFSGTSHHDNNLRLPIIKFHSLFLLPLAKISVQITRLSQVAESSGCSWKHHFRKYLPLKVSLDFQWTYALIRTLRSIKFFPERFLFSLGSFLVQRYFHQFMLAEENIFGKYVLHFTLHWRQSSWSKVMGIFIS